MPEDLFNSLTTLKTAANQVEIYWLGQLEKDGFGKMDRLPYSIRILLESVLRHCDGHKVTREQVLSLASWKAKDPSRGVIPYFPGRVLLQDFTGVPVIVDLAAMRSAVARLGGDPARINPVIPVDLVIDHSVQVDFYGDRDALKLNADMEFERNQERYEFLHWAQKAFANFKVVPPATGIVHQVNLEYLAKVTLTGHSGGKTLAYPDTLVGTDSHTTMINGLGVVGWGVGGIEAISAMLGEPIEMVIPDVIGFKLTGSLRDGVTPTDLTLTITEQLRQRRVVDKFVEFYGPGVNSLNLPDRAMVANMSPENGATITYFPVDQETLNYLRLTGRSEELIDLVGAYYRKQGLFREANSADPEYTDTLVLDLASVEPSLAGPRRPQDRVSLDQVRASFEKALGLPKSEGGYAVAPVELDRTVDVQIHGETVEMKHGDVAIAAITSCTNTSNPWVMVAAGLVAEKAVNLGLRVKPTVKTSLSPGSRVVTEYLEKAGLMEPLSRLGFDLTGYGCMTCIGNSGPLPEEVSKAISQGQLVAAAVLSGNRNFEGRINPQTQANYLASPPLVVAYALAGSVDKDIAVDPLGFDQAGKPVFLKQIWPSWDEIQSRVRKFITPEMFSRLYSDVYTGNERWNAIPSGDDPIFAWPPESTYIQEPPYFLNLGSEPPVVEDIIGGRVLVKLGDSITTDHISPAGAIPAKSAAGEYLLSLGVAVKDFNSFGARRGNDRIMSRGTFGNIRLKNQLLPEVEGSFTEYLPTGEQMSIFEASERYRKEHTPLFVLAGKEYGTGSSRDWAAKGPLLLGVRAVIAESFERIHRTNLVQMGILPLQFRVGEGWQKLGLTGREIYNIRDLREALAPGANIPVEVVRPDGSHLTIETMARIDTPLELEYYFRGGILQSVIYAIMKQQA